MAESKDIEVGWKADVENVLIKIEKAVKSDTKLFDIVYQKNRCTHDLDGSKIWKWLEFDWTQRTSWQVLEDGIAWLRL